MTSTTISPRLTLAIALAVTLRAESLIAQTCGDSAWTRAFITIGSIGEDALLRSELAGCGPASTLIRSPSALSRSLDAPARRVVVEGILPQVWTGWNSAIPLSMNDGGRWAGRGGSASLMAGARFRWWRISGVFAPEMDVSQNVLFAFRPAVFPGRSAYGSWVNVNLPSLDQPTRFGFRSFAAISPGQSSLEIRSGPAALGVSTENMWWGPGLRTAIVMSNNAAGIPQAFLRTTRPVVTPLGSFEGRVVLGVLTESPYFDFEPRNDNRSLSGAVATFVPAIDSNLTFGATRVSYGALRHVTGLGAHVLDFAQPLPARQRDEMQSVFAQWRFPASGFELHGEWARLRIPSFRELLVNPQRTQGYALGGQWSGAVIRPHLRLRLQAEMATLEQPREPDQSIPLSFYASRRVAQGYTQRGEVIGASTGPGSSSQWLASDIAAHDWSAGVELGRIRWNDDAYYTQTNVGRLYYTHDISLFAGISATRTFERVAIRASALRTLRMNYLFQSAKSGLFWDGSFDVRNTTLSLSAAFRR